MIRRRQKQLRGAVVNDRSEPTCVCRALTSVNSIAVQESSI